MSMIFLYIIGGLLCMIIAIFLLDRREKMGHEIKNLKSYQNDIREINEDLDALSNELNSFQKPLSKLNDVSQKILKFMK